MAQGSLVHTGACKWVELLRLEALHSWLGSTELLEETPDNRGTTYQGAKVELRRRCRLAALPDVVGLKDWNRQQHHKGTDD
jgi:hypothetical protein